LPYPNDDTEHAMQPGHVFTVEPVIHETSDTVTTMFSDEWTVVTADDSRTAQFEHTVLITEDVRLDVYHHHQ
jgi:methionyl aminopeptidase